MHSLLKKIVLACVLTSTTLIFSIPLVSASGMSKDAKAKLDKEITQMVGNDGTKVPALGVIVYKDGKEVYRNFKGRRYIDPQNPQNDLPMTADTRCRVASVSKQFVAFGIMQLVDQGKLDLDADISQYLGFTLRNPNFPDTVITARMLLSHTSSLRDGEVYSTPPSVGLQEYFKPDGQYYENGAHFAPADQTPGKYFTYSNLNYGVLGTIIERLSGERFDKYMNKHVLTPMDIKGSYNVGDFNAEDMKQVGVIYRKRKDGVWDEHGPWVPQMDDYRGQIQDSDLGLITNPDVRKLDGWDRLKDYKPGTNATSFSPQGGLRISGNEFSHLLEMLTHNGTYKGRQIVRPDLLAQMFKVHWKYDAQHPNGSTSGGSIEAYGLAEQIIDGKGTSRVVKDKVVPLQGHVGEAYGLMAGIMMRPGTQDGFIYISTGEAIAEDTDPRSAGTFSGNYIWEENIMNAICTDAFSEN